MVQVSIRAGIPQDLKEMSQEQEAFTFMRVGDRRPDMTFVMLNHHAFHNEENFIAV